MELMQLLCDHTEGELEEFQDYAYIYKNQEAIDHLFRVGTGLDSQILGDFEIIAQLKKSFTKAKKTGTTSPFLERLCNAVIQARKRIKNEDKQKRRERDIEVKKEHEKVRMKEMKKKREETMKKKEEEKKMKESEQLK